MRVTSHVCIEGIPIDSNWPRDLILLSTALPNLGLDSNFFLTDSDSDFTKNLSSFLTPPLLKKTQHKQTNKNCTVLTDSVCIQQLLLVLLSFFFQPIIAMTHTRLQCYTIFFVYSDLLDKIPSILFILLHLSTYVCLVRRRSSLHFPTISFIFLAFCFSILCPLPSFNYISLLLA